MNDAPAAGATRIDPRLEEAVLGILKKHGVLPVAQAARQSSRIEEAEDLEIFLELQRPSLLWRASRALLVLALVAGAAGVAAHWRYPAQTAAALSFARGAVGKVPVPRLFRSTVNAAPLPAPAPSTITPSDPAPQTLTSPTTPASTSAPAPGGVEPLFPPPTANADAKAIPPPPSAETKSTTVDVASLPVDTSHTSPSKADSKPTPRVATHAAAPTPPAHASAPVAAPVEARPAAPMVAAPAAPAIPGSLGEAIRRAGGVMPAAPAPTPAAAPEAKPSSAGLPDRPSASVVTSALLGALPEARACLSPGDETKAIVIFESSGSVSSVQASSAAAGCIQKAFAHAHVPPFAQPTYRAGVPIRAN